MNYFTTDVAIVGIKTARFWLNVVPLVILSLKWSMRVTVLNKKDENVRSDIVGECASCTSYRIAFDTF